MPDPYGLPGTAILINRFNLTTQQDLDDAEADFASLRLRELAKNPIEGDYGVRHYLAFHRYIFQDLYDWAGEPRKMNIAKEEPALGGLSWNTRTIPTSESGWHRFLVRCAGVRGTSMISTSWPPTSPTTSLRFGRFTPSERATRERPSISAASLPRSMVFRLIASSLRRIAIMCAPLWWPITRCSRISGTNLRSSILR